MTFSVLTNYSRYKTMPQFSIMIKVCDLATLDRL